MNLLVSWLPKELPASEEGLYSMELVRVDKVRFWPPIPLASNQIASSSVYSLGKADRKILPHRDALIWHTRWTYLRHAVTRVALNVTTDGLARSRRWLRHVVHSVFSLTDLGVQFTCKNEMRKCTSWTENSRPNLHKANLHHKTRKTFLWTRTGLLKRGFLTINENTQCPPWASTQDVLRLYSDRLARWKIPGLVWIT